MAIYKERSEDEDFEPVAALDWLSLRTAGMDEVVVIHDVPRTR